MTATSSVSVQARVITYPQRLLTLARSLIDGGEFGVAIVVVHMACEVATERSLSYASMARGIDYHKWAAKGFGYNLANDHVRRLYTELTSDAVEKTSFWCSFKESVGRRNKLVHGGRVTVTKQDAEDSFRAGSGLVAHLGK